MLFWFKKLNASTSLKARLLCSLNFCFSLISLLVCCTATFFLHISYADITLKYISQFFCFFWLHKMLLIVISTIARRIHQIILPSLHLLFNFLTYHTSKVSVRSVSLISLEEKLRQKKKKKKVWQKHTESAADLRIQPELLTPSTVPSIWQVSLREGVVL